MQGIEVLEKEKSCEFHFNHVVEWKIRQFDADKDQRNFTQQHQKNFLQQFEEFAVDTKIKHWIQWSGVQKRKIFMLFPFFMPHKTI